MHRRRSLRLAIAAMVAFTTLPATTAAAGSGDTPDTGDLDVVLTETLGMSSDQAAMFADTLNPVGEDFDEFGWGGDASVPATLSDDDAPWSTPTAVGLTFVNFQGSNLPDFDAPMEGMVMGTTEGGIVPNQTYMVATAVMGDDIPLGSAIDSFRQLGSTGGAAELFKQFDFALRIVELFAWVGFSQFPDDTWKGASFVMSLAYTVGLSWALSFYLFSQAGDQVLPADLSGFFILYGTVLMVAVLASGVGEFYPGNVGVRLAIDVKNAPANPDQSRVVRSPALQSAKNDDPANFFAAHPRTFVPGLDGRFDPLTVAAIVGPEGFLWFNLFAVIAWGLVPPVDLFSYYLQLGLFGDPSASAPNMWTGYTQHKGGTSAFAFDQESGEMPLDQAYVMNDGSLLFRTPWQYTGDPLNLGLDGGFLPVEGGDFKFNQYVTTIEPDDVFMEDDPTRHDGGHPVYDLVTGESVDPPPEATTTTTTTTTTTQPAATTESTEPAATTTTTQPRTTTTGTSTTGFETTPREACWWCWGAIFLFLVFLLAILYIWLKTYEWWTCWLPWFIVIFAWVPFLLAALWWWRPAWWWVPLLAWFPLVSGYTWFWARHRTWWRPWHLYAVGAYLAALVVGLVVVGAPEWGLLMPLFWVPWVAFYVWFRGARQPWFKPWMWLVFGGYVVWGFVWVVALSPWWAWWLPVALIPIIGWWFAQHGYNWRIIHGPKWCWIVPFTLLPFLAWWIPLWGPWWCFVIILFLAISVFCAILNHFVEEEWWTCWMPWALILWVGIPFLLAGLWFFGPNWWWLPLLGWFVVVPGCAYWWARHRSWWLPWHWYAVFGYLGIAAVLMYVVGAPEWGLLLPVFWLPPLAFWIWYRPMRRPWFQPWMWLLFAGYVGWVFYWVVSLTPFWGWWFPVFFVPFFGWWGVNHGYRWQLWARKATAVVPICLIPWIGYMLAVYCIPAYYM